MNINYLKALDKLNFTKSDIEKLWEEAQKPNEKSFENGQAYCIIENIMESLDMAVYKLKRLSLPVKQGRLVEDTSRGKFDLIQDNGRDLGGWLFSCGDYLEVLGDDGEWYSGRVEHTSRNGQTGYYFYNSELDHPFLYTGMKARVRRE